MSRIVLAFRSFFAILFKGELPSDIAQHFGFTAHRKPQPVAKTAPAARVPQAADGALQILGILQRDARLIDFLMEDISGYPDDQIGAAIRDLQQQCRESLLRYVQVAPVIDGVEGSVTKLDNNDPSTVKLLGNVPASGKAPAGLLRHKGWKAEKVDLPPVPSGSAVNVLAPAEVEIE